MKNGPSESTRYRTPYPPVQRRHPPSASASTISYDPLLEKRIRKPIFTVYGINKIIVFQAFQCLTNGPRVRNSDIPQKLRAIDFNPSISRQAGQDTIMYCVKGVK